MRVLLLRSKLSGWPMPPAAPSTATFACMWRPNVSNHDEFYLLIAVGMGGVAGFGREHGCMLLPTSVRMSRDHPSEVKSAGKRSLPLLLPLGGNEQRSS